MENDNKKEFYTMDNMELEVTEVTEATTELVQRIFNKYPIYNH